MLEDSVSQSQSAVGEMQAAAKAVLDSDLTKLADGEVFDNLTKLDGRLIHLERLRDKFMFDMDETRTEIRHLQAMQKV